MRTRRWALASASAVIVLASCSTPSPTPAPGSTLPATVPSAPPATAPFDQATPSAARTPVPAASPLVVVTADDVQRIGAAEARALQDWGGALLYDTRSTEEYHRLHAAGARPFPDTDAAARFGDLPTDAPLIFY
jgi:hypothetical protein